MRRAWLGLGVVCLLTGVNTVESRGGEEASLKLAAAQAEFLRQEPILVTLSVRGGSELNLPAAPGGESAARSLKFEIDPAVKPRNGARPLPEEARTERSSTRRYDLLEWFQFPASGEFTVRAVYEHAGSRVVSGPITVRVRAPKKGDADFDAVARIHHIPWSNYETNAFCGDTFDVVKRWPESRLAPYCHYWNGRYSQHQKEYARAIASYEELHRRYPGFVLTDDARRGLEECRELQASK